MESPFTDAVCEDNVAQALEARRRMHLIPREVVERKLLETGSQPKTFARMCLIPVSHPIRKQLWPRLINLRFGTSLAVTQPDGTDASVGAPTPCPSSHHSSDTPSSLTGYELADRRLQPTYWLNARGRATLLSLMHEVSLSRPELVYAPQAWAVLALLLHFHPAAEALACLLALLDQPDLLVQSKADWRAVCLAMEHLGAAGFAGSRAIGILRHHQAAFQSPGSPNRKGEPETVTTPDNQKRTLTTSTATTTTTTTTDDEVLALDPNPRYQLATWAVAVWLLPFECIVPLFDCFLVEGPKVLYRAGLLLWRLASKSEKPGSNCDLANHLIKAATTSAVTSDSRIFLRKIYNIRRFSKTHIQVALSKVVKMLPSNAGLELVDCLVVPCVLPGQRTYTAFGQVKAELAAKGRSSLRPRGSPAHNSVGRGPLLPSSLISADEFSFLIAGIADETLVQAYLPTLIFSSSTDGVSLNTLFQRCADHAETSGRPETILLVRTASGHGLVGAFCSQVWQAGNEFSYYGNGHTFLFRLRPGPPRLWKWCMDGAHGTDRFQRATARFLEVGGGLDAGPAGLRLETGLEMAQSGPSPTFNSECLIAPEDREMQSDLGEGKVYCHFRVSLVEVLGFKSAAF
uniref:TBC1 domain family member 24 n=1 Tax=Schistocephalus solidus TaxID=70667 RepID=A0A0X3PIB8_SCHSO